MFAKGGERIHLLDRAQYHGIGRQFVDAYTRCGRAFKYMSEEFTDETDFCEDCRRIIDGVKLNDN